MKKNILVFLLLTLSSWAYSQPLTRVAIVDYEKLLDYYRQNNDITEELDAIQKNGEEKLLAISEEISRLETLYKEARQKNNDADESRYRKEISDKKQKRISKLNEIADEKRRVRREASSVSHLKEEIGRVIAKTAFDRGFSLIINKSDDDLLWYNVDIDLTEEVLQSLFRNSAS